MDRLSSYLAPALEARPVPGTRYQGVFAIEPLSAGALICVWGGEVMTLTQLQTQPDLLQQLSIQVEEALYLVSTYPSPGDRINHSCDPTAWLEGQIVLRARRAIKVGEQVTFDYATSDGSPYDEFDCDCGAASCRKRVTGNDWRIPDLQERYAGHFMPYLQRRIDALHATAKGNPSAP